VARVSPIADTWVTGAADLDELHAAERASSAAPPPGPDRNMRER